MLKAKRLLLLILLLLTQTLYGEQTYILSYRCSIKNAVVLSESLHISPSMSKVDAKPSEHLRIYAPNEYDLNTILHQHQDKLLDFLMHKGVHTRSYQHVHNQKSSSLIFLTLPPTYITVDFNDDYVTITRLIT